MSTKLKILILEDSRDDVDLIERELQRGGIEFIATVVQKKAEYEKALEEFRPDVILCDHSLPQFNSIEAMQVWKAFQKEKKLFIPFILVTGSVSEEFAVQSIKAGADDYILKDRLKRLPSSVKSALARAKTEKERMDYLEEVISLSVLMKEAEHLAKFGGWKVDLVSGKYQCSEETYRIFGLEPGEADLDLEAFLKYVHPDDKEFMINKIQEGINTAAFQECEYRIIDKNRKVKNLQSRIMIKRDAENKAYQLVGFTLDITKHKEQTQALEIQNRNLREIAWVQSHEVRGPLARLLGLVHLLNRSPEVGGELRETIKHLSVSANELDEIVRRIVRKTEDLA